MRMDGTAIPHLCSSRPGSLSVFVAGFVLGVATMALHGCGTHRQFEIAIPEDLAVNPSEEIEALRDIPVTGYPRLAVAVEAEVDVESEGARWQTEAVAAVLQRAAMQHDLVVQFVPRNARRKKDGELAPIKLHEPKTHRATHSMVAKVSFEEGGCAVVALELRDHEVSLESTEIKIDFTRSGWSLGLEDEAAKQLMLVAGRHEIELERLSDDMLKNASQAAVLAADGQLLEAINIYKEIIPSPSAHLRIERDYIKVLSRMGILAAARERAAAVLSGFPEMPSTICLQSDLELWAVWAQIYQAGSMPLNEVRLLVRRASACGDPNAEAFALSTYARVFENIHFPSAEEANRVAVEILEEEDRHGWAKCYSSYRKFQLDRGRGHWGTHIIHRANRVAAECKIAQYWEGQGAALNIVASAAMHTQEKIDTWQNVIGIQPMGSVWKMQYSFDLAQFLTSIGAHSRLHRTLVYLMGHQLLLIEEYCGGLPAEEHKLKDDVIKEIAAAKISEKTARLVTAKQVRTCDSEIGRFERTLFSISLRYWAGWTHKYSEYDAQRYMKIAESIQGSADTPWAIVATDPEGMLSQSGLTLAEIRSAEETGAGPVLGADLYSASNALLALLDRQAAGNAETGQLERTLKDAEVVARWLDHPITTHKVELQKARLLGMKGKPLEGAALAASLTLGDSPEWEHERLNMWAWLYVKSRGSSREELEKGLRKLVEQASRLSPKKWVQSLYDYHHQLIRLLSSNAEDRRTAAQNGANELYAASIELSNRGMVLSAASALQASAQLFNSGYPAGRTETALQLLAQSIKKTDEFGDPVRSVQARIYYLSELNDFWFELVRDKNYVNMFWARVPLDFPAIADICSEVVNGLRELANTERVREAARLGLQVDARIPGHSELVKDVETWLSKLGQSKEFDSLRAQLNELSGDFDDGADRRLKYIDALEGYEKTNDEMSVVQILVKLMNAVHEEDKVWDYYDQCEERQGAEPHQCIVGVAVGLTVNVLKNYSGFNNDERLKRALDEAWKSFSAATFSSEHVKLERLSLLGLLAARADDEDRFHRVTRQISGHPAWVPFFLRVLAAAAPDRPQSFLFAWSKLSGKLSEADRSRFIDEVMLVAKRVGDDALVEHCAQEMAEAFSRDELSEIYGKIYSGDRERFRGKYRRARAVYKAAKRLLGTKHEKFIAHLALRESIAHAYEGRFEQARKLLKPYLEQPIPRPADTSVRSCVEISARQVSACLDIAAGGADAGEQTLKNLNSVSCNEEIGYLGKWKCESSSNSRSFKGRFVQYLVSYDAELRIATGDVAIEDKQWRAASNHYLAAREMIAPMYREQDIEIIARIAMSYAFRGDLRAARKELKPYLASITTRAEQEFEWTCAEADLLHVTAAIDFAQRRCEQGKKHRKLANEKLARCGGASYLRWVGENSCKKRRFTGRFYWPSRR